MMDLQELLHQGSLQVQIGCCENTDPKQFRMEGFDGEHILVRCLKCHEVTTLSAHTDSPYNASGKAGG